jgi:predicted HTH transcriptional regulator
MGDLEGVESSKTVPEYLSEGKNLTQDFLPSTINHHHTAALISSFANSIGGELLIGINSKGKVIGVLPSEEEENILFILKNFCTHNLDVKFSQIVYDYKYVLIVHIPQAKPKGVAALSKYGNTHFFVRTHSGEVFESNKVIEKSWKINSTVQIENEYKLLETLDFDKGILISQIYKKTSLRKSEVDKLMAVLLCKNDITYEFENSHILYLRHRK